MNVSYIYCSSAPVLDVLPYTRLFRVPRNFFESPFIFFFFAQMCLEGSLDHFFQLVFFCSNFPDGQNRNAWRRIWAIVPKKHKRKKSGNSFERDYGNAIGRDLSETFTHATQETGVTYATWCFKTLREDKMSKEFSYSQHLSTLLPDVYPVWRPSLMRWRRSIRPWVNSGFTRLNGL